MKFQGRIGSTKAFGTGMEDGGGGVIPAPTPFFFVNIDKLHTFKMVTETIFVSLALPSPYSTLSHRLICFRG